MFDGQPGRDTPTQSLACHQPHEVEKGLVAVDEHALVILETDEVGNGIQQAALQQLLLAEGLLQLLALIDGADHGKQGDGIAVLVIQGNLVDLHPAGAFAAVAMELLVQQGFAVGQQAVIFLPEYIPQGISASLLPMSSLGSCRPASWRMPCWQTGTVRACPGRRYSWVTGR